MIYSPNELNSPKYETEPVTWKKWTSINVSLSNTLTTNICISYTISPKRHTQRKEKILSSEIWALVMDVLEVQLVAKSKSEIIAHEM